jgi:sugar diacid utilization regulator
MADTTSDEIVQRCGNLVRIASVSDAPEGLVVAASQALSRPLVLLDPTGAPLVASPACTSLDPSVGTLGAAIRQSGRTLAGWHVLPVEHEGRPLAFLAVRDGEAGEPAPHGMLDLVVSLLGDQLRRAALASAVCSERRAALMRRLVMDDAITAAEIRSDATAAGLGLADSYWPALLVWMVGHPGPRTFAEVQREAHDRVADAIAVTLDNTTIAVLFPGRGPCEPSPQDVHRDLGRLVRHARHLGHRDVLAIAGERSVGVAHVARFVGQLQQLQHYLPPASTEALVRPARSFALDRLLSEGLDRSRAEAFVRGRLRPLLRHDVDHGTDLARVLELALDCPRRDDAARAGYMHRNTFRRHLTQALELVNVDLEDPDDRLALHVALRLRRLLEAPRQQAGTAAPRPAEHRHGATSPGGRIATVSSP